ncbi:HAD family hydrolase [Streptomyces sp. G5(2025)]|uniref:HAD family hydrolase n=1 Tax=Streptomyces sp. G5(2025) TaxID=3406628 RepID=UPI003C1ACC0F
MTSTVPALGTPLHSLGPATQAPAPRVEGATLQGVLLDMDGTLVDTEGFWWDAEVEVFARLGHTLDEAWRDIVVGGPMTRSAGFLIDSTGADITVDELTVLLNDGFEERISRSLPLMPGAASLLAELAAHDVPMALVSASHRRIIDRVLDSIGAHHFELTIAGDEVPRTKPHPDPYLLAAAGIGAEPTRCAVIEDTATGVAAAEAAGCRVVAVPSVAPIPQAAGRTVVPSLEHVNLPFLQGLMTL